MWFRQHILGLVQNFPNLRIRLSQASLWELKLVLLFFLSPKVPPGRTKSYFCRNRFFAAERWRLTRIWNIKFVHCLHQEGASVSLSGRGNPTTTSCQSGKNVFFDRIRVRLRSRKLKNFFCVSSYLSWAYKLEHFQVSNSKIRAREVGEPDFLTHQLSHFWDH